MAAVFLITSFLTYFLKLFAIFTCAWLPVTANQTNGLDQFFFKVEHFEFTKTLFSIPSIDFGEFNSSKSNLIFGENYCCMFVAIFVQMLRIVIQISIFGFCCLYDLSNHFAAGSCVSFFNKDEWCFIFNLVNEVLLYYLKKLFFCFVHIAFFPFVFLPILNLYHINVHICQINRLHLFRDLYLIFKRRIRFNSSFCSVSTDAELLDGWLNLKKSMF